MRGLGLEEEEKHKKRGRVAWTVGRGSDREKNRRIKVSCQFLSCCVHTFLFLSCCVYTFVFSLFDRFGAHISVVFNMVQCSCSAEWYPVVACN
jgi:hypothetical protein